MKPQYFGAISVLLTIFLIQGCASSPVTLDSKYVFTEFETVDHLRRSSLTGWQVIDSQSLIVQTGPSSYYLLILGHRMDDLNFAETIILTSTGNRIEARFDCVEVVGPSCSPRSIPAAINTIYKLNGRDDVAYVREQISGR